jgi:peptidoglycan/xylan/chitin deacetylase (PgdA/CDA1 family)
MPTTLMYHDVVEDACADSSGFTGPAARRYKLRPRDFEAHLESLARALDRPPITIDQPARLSDPESLVLTFDDGGVSCYAPIAELLDRFGWRGHFFVPTDSIQTPGFMTVVQIRSLRARGHVIGSHSCSHPIPMWAYGEHELREEWHRSKSTLEEILAEPVTTASIPGGFYSRKVARAAADAGIRVLFTSEPTRRCHVINDCAVLGRFTILRGTAGRTAVALASGRKGPRFRQALCWNLRKIAKIVAGKFYLRCSKRILAGA